LVISFSASDLAMYAEALEKGFDSAIAMYALASGVGAAKFLELSSRGLLLSLHFPPIAAMIFFAAGRSISSVLLIFTCTIPSVRNSTEKREGKSSALLMVMFYPAATGAGIAGIDLQCFFNY
jgi:hypothetical protein